jgi:plastocyanin
MSNTNSTTAAQAQQTRWLVIALIGLVAFFASYRFAQAQNPGANTASASSGVAAASPLGSAPGAAGAPAAGGGCCGGGGPVISKQAEVAGGVQKIAVDLSSGSYNPSEIVLKAGVPAEITFGQSSGCTAQVQSQDLGFSEDLSGGPKTVKIPALKAGTYNFACGMNMVSGTIVVK